MSPNKKNLVETKSEKETLENALKSSTGFANPYGEDEYQEDGAIEKLSPEDDEFDFGIEDFGDDEDDIDEIKKAFRH